MQFFQIYKDRQIAGKVPDKVAYFYNRFNRLYGNQAHFVLACHAAFPFAIIVDLLL